MTVDEIIKLLDEAKHKGSYVRHIIWNKTLSLRKKKALKGEPIPENLYITKTTSMSMRLGINYGNMKTTKEQHGEDYVPGSLPWGSWVKGYEKYLIQHNGNYYLRIAEGINANSKPVTIYYKNGVPCTKQEAQNYCLNSNFNTQNSNIYDINIANIISISK